MKEIDEFLGKIDENGGKLITHASKTCHLLLIMKYLTLVHISLDSCHFCRSEVLFQGA